MVRRDHVPAGACTALPARRTPRGKAKKAAEAAMPLFSRYVTDEALARIRQDFPGWDVHALKAEFDEWIDAKPSRAPKDYNGAFYGFVRQHAARNRA